MVVYKSDRSYEEYNPEKVRDGICKAYTSIGEVCQNDLINSIVSNLFIYEKISSKEIRRQVEESLMSINKKVAKAYIEKFKEINNDNDALKDKDDFIQSYIKASNASTGSKYDANANVNNKNIATLNAEIPKRGNIMFNRYNTSNKIANMFSKKLARQYYEDLNKHIVYKHDESTFGINSPYCVAIQSYPFLVNGLKGLGGLSAAPKNLDSFCGMFVNLIFAVSSQFAGAVASAGALLMFDYYARKEWGDNYFMHDEKTAKIKYIDGVEKTISISKQIEQYFQQIVYSINQPAAARGFQSAFVNFGYFDKPYFEGMYGQFQFPDGTKPQWESLSYIQKKFMKWFNKERTKCILTFPVETMSLLYKDGEFVDKEYADFTAEMYSEGHSFFTYISDSPDTLSSCCFNKEQKTLVKIDGIIHNINFDELYKITDSKIETIFDGKWVDGKVIKLDNRKMFKITTSNNKEIIVSDNHINVTCKGDKQTKDLTTDDYLKFNTKVLEGNNKEFTFDDGITDGLKILERDGVLDLKVLDYSVEYRKGVLEGIATNSKNTFYTIDEKNLTNIEILITSLGMTSEISSVEDVFMIRWYEPKNNTAYFKIKSVEEFEYGDDIYCFEMSDEPYFTLPNGIVTHNCRLSNKINENTFSFTNGLTGEATGSKSVITLNYNRIIQDFVNENYSGERSSYIENKNDFTEKFKPYLISILERVYKYHTAYNEVLWDLYDANMLPVYSAGFIHLNKQYLTLGINGLNEAWMFLNGECKNTEEYQDFCKLILTTMKEQNHLHKTKKTMFNSEFVPAESLGIKNYKWDMQDGYWVPEGRNCYTSYFFLPDDESVNIIEKMKLHGKDYVTNLDGGSACHLNLKEHLSKEQYASLLEIAGSNGTNYFTFNVKNSQCNDCGYISKSTIEECPHCGGNNIDYYTRIIGYLVKVESFNEGRKVEEHKRIYN